MLGPEFASCWLKILRAEEHAATLEREVGEWKNSNPYASSIKCNADGSRHSVFITINTGQSLMDRLSLVAADCVHNLRSALDQFLYAAAVHKAGVDPPT